MDSARAASSTMLFFFRNIQFLRKLFKKAALEFQSCIAYRERHEVQGAGIPCKSVGYRRVGRRPSGSMEASWIAPTR